MIAECFLDTNVLVYAASGRGAEEAKRQAALALIEKTEFGLSAQVLQEFLVTVTRKIAVPLGTDRALDWLEQLDPFPCLPVDRALVKVAAEISERFRVSYRDAAILAAAAAMNAPVVYSEDLNDGQVYDGVTVRDPFRA